MHSGLKFRGIFGVRVYADWSWIFHLLLVTWGLAVVVFPGLYPHWNTVLTWGIAFAASLLFFVCVVVHELAHSLVAKAYRIPIRDITLFPYGGIPNIPYESTCPANDIVMAALGPATSLLLGGILLILGLVRASALNPTASDALEALNGLDPLVTLLLWLGAINLLLGALNLVPGFPLDGGRVLRSILWKATQSPRRATHWASRAGQLAAWGLIAAGMALALGARPPFSGALFLGGLWLGFLGGILNRAAGQINHLVAVDDLLANIAIAQFMGARVPMVPPNIPLSSLVEDYIAGTDSPAFPVIENDHLVGLVCTRDVYKVPRDEWDTTEVGEIMTSASRLAVARPDRIGIDALKQLAHESEQAASGVGQLIRQKHS